MRWGTLTFPGPPLHLTIFNSRGFRSEFLSPRLHHEMIFLSQRSRAARRGGFKRGGFPIWTCPSFFVLFSPFWDFPDFSGIFPIWWSGIFPICPFPLSRPIKSTYEEQSRKDPRDTIWTFPEKSHCGKPPGLVAKISLVEGKSWIFNLWPAMPPSLYGNI